MRFLDVAFALGVMVQILKLGDLLLRPSQQRWIQEKADTCALILSDVRLGNLYVAVTSSAAMSALQGVMLLPVWLYFGREVQGPGVTWVLLPALLVTYLFNRYLGRQMRAWIWVQDEYLLTINRAALTGTIISLGLGYLFKEAGRVISVVASGRFGLLAVTAALLLSVLIVLSAPILLGLALWCTSVTVTGYAIYALVLTIHLVAPVLSLLRALAWRVAEHNKGAWAALSALMTAAIGVADLWLAR